MIVGGEGAREFSPEYLGDADWLPFKEQNYLYETMTFGHFSEQGCQ